VKTNATIGNDVAQAPDGTNTADKLKEDSSPSIGHHSGQSLSTSIPTGQISTASVYVKAQERNWIILEQLGTLGGGYAWFDVANGAIGNQVNLSHGATITDVGNGWYRCTISDTATGTSGQAFRIYLSTGNGVVSYSGDGSSGVLVWGAQLEPGTATDYVRTVDVVGKDYGWYEPTEGTVFADVVPAYDGAQSASVVAFNTTTYQESNIIYKANSTSTGTGLRWVAQTFDGATQATLPTPTDIADVEASLAFGYKHNDFGFGVEGSLIGPDPTGTTPNPSQMHIMNRDGSLHLNGHIRRLTYWPRRQSDSTLQVITQ
jgi:hypothetical protein